MTYFMPANVSTWFANILSNIYSEASRHEHCVMKEPCSETWKRIGLYIN